MAMRKIIIDNWQDVLLKAYSVWGNWALIVLVLAPDFIYLTTGIDTNPKIWSRLLIITALFTVIGRFIDQPKEGAWVRRGIILAFVIALSAVSIPALAQTYDDDEVEAYAFDLISRWEGENRYGSFHKSYKDMVGVWTVCYGHTRTAGPGQYRTDDECKLLLIDEIKEYRRGLHRYFYKSTIQYRLTPQRDAAYTSLAFNVGVVRAGKSTATRRLNRGDIEGGCEALTWWNQAGGRVVRGLVRRRSEEADYCLMGV